MSIAKVTEISASSKKSFEHAINEGLARANDTIDHIEGACARLDVDHDAVIRCFRRQQFRQRSVKFERQFHCFDSKINARRKPGVAFACKGTRVSLTPTGSRR